jgi:(2R)-ethylmalonyl-CoA mutase
LRAAGLEHVPLIVGGIVPPADAERLKAAGVAAVYTPKDFAINGILGAIVQEVEARWDAEQTAGAPSPKPPIQPEREFRPSQSK